MKLVIAFWIVVFTNSLYAQSKLPIIKATSKKVSVRDGDFFDKDSWTLTPGAKPDIFTADRTRLKKWVVFYTDVDSFKVKLEPAKAVDFIILLNGKDSCYTRIQSAIPKEGKIVKLSHDTIPFVLTEKDVIAVKAIANAKDTLTIHFDVGSFDFRFIPSTFERYPSLKKVNTIQLGGLIVENPTIVRTKVTATNMDGRFGWNMFEGKSVEINYEKKCLVIHSKLPKQLKGYSKAKLVFIRSFPCINLDIVSDSKVHNGFYIIDTGTDKALVLDSAWTRRANFINNLKVSYVSKLSDPRGKIYETKTVVTPQVKISNYLLADVPATILAGENPTQFEINLIGTGILKRFNTILDFKNDWIYLKPNELIDVSYKATL